MKPHDHPHELDEHPEIVLGVGIHRLIVAEVKAEVARQLAAATCSPDSEQLLSVPQVAERIGMSISFVRAAVRDGRLPSERIGRAVRVRAAALTVLTQATRRKAIADPSEHAERILGLGRGMR